jgi:hypothetical protein
MIVVIVVAANEGRGYQGGDEEEGEEISPLEDIERPACGV